MHGFRASDAVGPAAMHFETLIRRHRQRSSGTAACSSTRRIHPRPAPLGSPASTSITRAEHPLSSTKASFGLGRGRRTRRRRCGASILPTSERCGATVLTESEYLNSVDDAEATPICGHSIPAAKVPGLRPTAVRYRYRSSSQDAIATRSRRHIPISPRTRPMWRQVAAACSATIGSSLPLAHSARNSDLPSSLRLRFALSNSCPAVSTCRLSSKKFSPLRTMTSPRCRRKRTRSSIVLGLGSLCRKNSARCCSVTSVILSGSAPARLLVFRLASPNRSPLAWRSVKPNLSASCLLSAPDEIALTNWLRNALSESTPFALETRFMVSGPSERPALLVEPTAPALGSSEADPWRSAVINFSICSATISACSA